MISQNLCNQLNQGTASFEMSLFKMAVADDTP